MTIAFDPRTASTGEAEALLRQARRMVESVEREWIAKLPSAVRSWQGFHLGWWDENGTPTHTPARKAIRPALAIASARAVGGTAQDAVPAAVAVELVHNFSLLHDDIIDRDTERRHRPAVWSRFGLHAGILAGDSLFALAFRVLADSAVTNGAHACAMLAEMTQELVDGEASDVAFETRTTVTVAEYEAMATGKTGSLMGTSCALGALAGGASIERAAELEKFGRNLGIAFQAVDDLLGIYGESKNTGKPVGADLAARKKSLPVVAALAADGPAARELADLYATPGTLSDQQLIRAADLIETTGGRALAHRIATERTKTAFTHLAAADPEPAASAELAGLAWLTVGREY